jgi:hypothetical protein
VLTLPSADTVDPFRHICTSAAFEPADPAFSYQPISRYACNRRPIGSLDDLLLFDIFPLSINRSDWLARLATVRGVTCAARGDDVLFCVNSLHLHSSHVQSYHLWARTRLERSIISMIHADHISTSPACSLFVWLVLIFTEKKKYYWLCMRRCSCVLFHHIYSGAASAQMSGGTSTLRTHTESLDRAL